MNRFPDSLDSPVDQLKNHREFQHVLELLETWFAYKTKLHIGLFHEFYMVRFEGWIVSNKPGYFFQPEGPTSTNIVFFASPAKPYKISEVGGRTCLTLGEVGPNSSALVLTENVDELIQFAMHLKPIA